MDAVRMYLDREEKSILNCHWISYVILLNDGMMTIG